MSMDSIQRALEGLANRWDEYIEWGSPSGWDQEMTDFFRKTLAELRAIIAAHPEEAAPSREELRERVTEAVLSEMVCCHHIQGVAAKDCGTCQSDAKRIADHILALLPALREVGEKLFHALLYRDDHDTPAYGCFTKEEQDALDAWTALRLAAAAHSTLEREMHDPEFCRSFEEEAAKLAASETPAQKRYVECPFCGEDDFDLIGLRHHLMVIGCEAFDKTPLVGQPVIEEPAQGEEK